jgi:hypothetical protein
MHKGTSMKQMAQEMLFCFTNIFAEILLHTLGNRFNNDYSILANFWQKALPLKASRMLCAKDALIWCQKMVKLTPVACTINIYDRRFYDRNDIGLYYNTLETIVIDNPSLS